MLDWSCLNSSNATVKKVTLNAIASSSSVFDGKLFTPKYNLYKAYWHGDFQKRMRCITWNHSDNALRVGNSKSKLCSIRYFGKLIFYRVLKYIF